MSIKYGLIVHRHKNEVNIGDYIQAIAVKQALGLSKEDFFLIDREDLGAYDGENVRIVGQGWYCHSAGAWPPSKKIDYLPLGIHINPQSHSLFLKPESIEALNRYAPIGCRDMMTHGFLKKHNIDSYFSGCLTVTIKPSNIPRKPEKIFLIDATKSALKLLPKDLRNLPVVELSHLLPHPDGRKWEHDELFKIAQERLDLYYSSAAVVVTSRIHALMPSMAMGIPCLWVERRVLDRRIDLARRYAKPFIFACPDRLSPLAKTITEGLIHPLIAILYRVVSLNALTRIKPRMNMQTERERILNELQKAKSRLGW